MMRSHRGEVETAHYCQAVFRCRSISQKKPIVNNSILGSTKIKNRLRTGSHGKRNSHGRSLVQDRGKFDGALVLFNKFLR